MPGPFPNLEAACGGKINPETLEQFQKAMREYEEFMAGMREMFRPVDDGGDDEWTGAPRHNNDRERFGS